MKLSILIPAFREESTIATVIERVLAADTAGFTREVIVCDDGSGDRTYEIAHALVSRHPGLQVLRHETNQGKGAAIVTALARATGDYVLVQDADLEYDVGDYPALLNAARAGADAVFGSRFLARRHPKGMQLPNLVANRILTFAANQLYSMRITDEATCFKLVRTDLLRDMKLECKRFEFCPEVTAKLGRRGIRIAEVPIAYEGRTEADGKKIRWTDGVEALWVLIKHRVGS